MRNKINIFLIYIGFLLVGCSKKENQINVLQDTYDIKMGEAQEVGEDFTIQLNGGVLQPGERGEWQILQGKVVGEFVLIEEKNNPFSRFRGIPGEEYLLEWKKIDNKGKMTTASARVKIPEPKIEITDQTTAEFQTIRNLAVNPKYRGVWSASPSYARIESSYHDGYAEPPENKPTIFLHGYANTTYTVTYTYTYGGKVFRFSKQITTGNYTEDEGLYELQLSKTHHRVIVNNVGNVLELNLASSGITWLFSEIDKYPSLQSFKKLRKLSLGGSSLLKIPSLFGDYYRDLEELNMDGMGENLTFPSSFGNLTKLKTLIVRPMRPLDINTEYENVLPKSFANLKSLESFQTSGIGYIDFNGTLGELVNLKSLETPIREITEDIGELKKLQKFFVQPKSAAFPQRFAECENLKYMRIHFKYYNTGKTKLSTNFGNLKKLEELDIEGNTLYDLPMSFAGLSSLKRLRISGSSFQSIPSNFGQLSNLENLTLIGVFTELPSSIGDLNRLTHLYLGGRAEILPESIGDLSSLVYFNAESSYFKTLPNSIGNLKKLKEINFARGKLETIPLTFGNLDALEKLDFSGNQLKTFPRAIIGLKNISLVYLTGNEVGDIPDEIVNIKKGINFYIYQASNLTLTHLKYITSITKGLAFYTSFGFYMSNP